MCIGIRVTMGLWRVGQLVKGGTTPRGVPCRKEELSVNGFVQILESHRLQCEYMAYPMCIRSSDISSKSLEGSWGCPARKMKMGDLIGILERGIAVTSACVWLQGNSKWTKHIPNPYFVLSNFCHISILVGYRCIYTEYRYPVGDCYAEAVTNPGAGTLGSQLPLAFLTCLSECAGGLQVLGARARAIQAVYAGLVVFSRWSPK